MKSSRALAVLDKLGATGAFLAAAAAPCCFPMLAGVGGALGLGALQGWRGYVDYAIQGFVLISATGTFFSYRRHRRVWPLAIALGSAALVFFAFYADYHVAFIYTGLAGLAGAAVWNLVATGRTQSCRRRVELQSIISCPHCSHQKQETMPTDACLYFYECGNCHVKLKPKPGDCCVFCSYGSVKCPPMQSGHSPCSE